MRYRLAVLVLALIASFVLNMWLVGEKRRVVSRKATVSSEPAAEATAKPTPSEGKNTAANLAPTKIYAHNLMLRKGPNFRIYVRWLRGDMARARRDVNPSFDNPDSFFLDIKTGVLRANIGDIGHFLDASLPAKSPLKNVKLSADGDQLKLNGTLHKIIPLPIEMKGTVNALPGNRIQIHVTKLSVLKIPLKGLLGDFHLSLSDLFQPKGMPGIQVKGNDIFFDTQQLLPPPYIRGELTKVRVVSPDLEEVYGNAAKEVQRVEQWRNFLRFHGGTIDFGKLTMHQVDIVMVDISNDPWFDLDLAHYQKQLVNGYTHMTPQAGLQIFMPDLDELPKTKATDNIGIEWMKNRNVPPPASVTSK